MLPQRPPTFLDFDARLKAHPIKEDFFVTVDVQAIENAVKMLILTNLGDRPFNTGVGGDVRRALFGLNTIHTVSLVKSRIEQVLTTYEPRIKINGIDVQQNKIDQNIMTIGITYSILNYEELRTLNLNITVDR